METAVVLLTIVCYALAIFLGWQWRTPMFVFALLAGHISSLVSPIWSFLYGFTYAADLKVFSSVAGLTFIQPLIIAASWFYTLPALLVIALYRLRLWRAGYLTGMLTFAGFLGYHLLLEIFGMGQGIWEYTMMATLPLGIANWMLSALMATLISLATLYILLMVFRYSWVTMFALLVPAPLIFSVVVRGMLGAPLWISRLLRAESWAASIGVICTLAFLAWAVHIVVWGISRVDREITV